MLPDPPYKRRKKPPTHGVGGGVTNFNPNGQSDKLLPAISAKPKVAVAHGGRVPPKRAVAIAALLETKRKLLGS